MPPEPLPGTEPRCIRCEMDRRRFIEIAISATALANLSPSLHATECGVERLRQNKTLKLSELEAFNYVVGTQAIGATYQFTNEPLMVETARRILEMGSNVLKLKMGPGYETVMLRAAKSAYPNTMQALLNQGKDAREKPRRNFPGASTDILAPNPAMRNLTDLARKEPAYGKVFSMPFAYYHIWTYGFTPAWWHNGFPVPEQVKEYKELYGFASYLLKTYSGTGKTFYLGHWEGDWHLRPHLNAKSDDGVTPAAIQGMIDWLNTRQRAIDDARQNTRHRDVNVFHYTEVNLVNPLSIEGRISVTNSVLPKTNVDYVSYSTYDALDDIKGKIPKALDYIESKLSPKTGIIGKRVFIGEYGFAARAFGEAERDRKSREVIRIALEWGCPFVLCWQMYNNEFSEGRDTGYWLVDNHGAKQRLWHTHHHFLERARAFVSDFRSRHHRAPSANEFHEAAIHFLTSV